MFSILHALGMFVADLFKSRCRLEAENLRWTRTDTTGRHCRRCGADQWKFWAKPRHSWMLNCWIFWEVAGCVYRKPHPVLIFVLAGEILYSCARIPCTAEKISYFVD